MNCPRCQKEVPENAEFCPFCAAPVLAAAKCREILDVQEDTLPDDIKQKYYAKQNELQLLIQNAPTPLLKERYNARLDQVRTAAETLLGPGALEQKRANKADLPSARPVDAPEPVLPPQPVLRGEPAPYQPARPAEKAAYTGQPDKSRTTARLLAFFFGPFTWLYTYKKDWKKFWISFAAYFAIFLLVLFLILMDTSYLVIPHYVVKPEFFNFGNLLGVFLIVVFGLLIFPGLFYNIPAFIIRGKEDPDIFQRYDTLFPEKKADRNAADPELKQKFYAERGVSALLSCLALALLIGATCTHSKKKAHYDMVMNPVFQDRGDGTVSEQNTGLTWLQEPVETEAPEPHLKTILTGNHKDWRIPTYAELSNLLHAVYKHNKSIRYGYDGYMRFNGFKTRFDVYSENTKYWCIDKGKIAILYYSWRLYSDRIPAFTIAKDSSVKKALLWAVR